MQPQAQNSSKKTIVKMALHIVIAAVIAAVLVLLSVSVIRLHTNLASMQESFDYTKETMDFIAESIDYTYPVFTIASFEQKYVKDEYGEAYSGEAIIACDMRDAFIVILKTTLVSGGSSYTTSTSYNLIIVQDGLGKYSTYDWAEPGKLEKPRYEFEVAGYFKAETSGG